MKCWKNRKMLKNKVKRNKKAQVGVVSVVLIVLIVLVSVMILWNILNPYIKAKGKEVEEKGEVLNVNLEIKNAVLFPTGASRVSVYRRAGKGEISSLKIVFYDEQGNSKAETIENNLPEELETKTYRFSPFAELGTIKNIAVLPVIGKGIGLEAREERSKVLEIPSGLISWWSFDSGGEDFVGNNNCNPVNIINDAERGSVASFSGVAADCGNDSSLDITEKIAISFWLKTNDENGTIIKKGNNYKVSLKNKRIEFSYISNGNLQNGTSSDLINLANGNWHHVVISEAWQGDKNLRIYINGELDNTINLKEPPETNTENVSIGNFQGYLDELMFFNKSLSIGEVKGLFDNQK